MRSPFRMLATLTVLLLLLLVLLPGRSEVRREALIAASPAVVLATLEGLEGAPGWASWTPAREGSLLRTARTEQGLWFDVEGERERRAAVQVSPEGAGTRVVWTDVEHHGHSVVLRLLGLLREGRVGPELEASLSGLRAACE